MGLLSTLGGIAGNFLLPGIGGVIGAGLGGAIEGSESVGQASGAQVGKLDEGIAEQRRQFDAIQQLLQPYTEAGASAIQGLSPYAAAGPGALAGQQAFLGLQGPEAERAAIERIRGGETFQALSRQGEEALLQRASATGGLRGGNIQGALAQFRPALLSSLIEQQYSRLGGLTSLGAETTGNIARLGQASAAGTGAAAQTTGANIANLLGQQGAAQAGGILGEQGALTGGIGKAFGAIQGAGGFGKLFGGSGGGGGGGIFQDVGGMGAASNAALSEYGIF